MAETYWAASEISEIAGKIEQKFEDYKKWLETTGYGNRIKISYQRFYAMDEQGALRIVRDKDDIARIDVNHLRSLLKRMHIMCTENKLAYQPKANNSDSKSQMQSDIARGLCEYYGDEKNMNKIVSQSVLGSLIMMEQIIHAPWDISEGYELGVEDGNAVKSGDQKFELYSALNVARNTSSEKSNWYIIRCKVNKYDLAVLHPEFKDEILSSGINRDVYDMDFSRHNYDSMYIDDDDYTHKYILYHKRTPSMPDGRWTEICATQVLRDGSLVYEDMPVVRMTAGDILETCYGDSPSIDLLGLQQAMNALFSGATTNGLNNAIQLLWSPDPSMSTRVLETGQIAVTSAVEPKSLNLNGSNAETLKLIEIMMQHEQLLSGVNEVARGSPGASLKSGVSLAVVLAQAIQYISEVQKNMAEVAGDLASILMANLRQFGPEELIGYIVGDSRKGHVKKFKKRDIMDIARVTVDLGNPLTQTLAGRWDVAKTWTEMGIMKNPKQIEAFIKSGNLDAVTEDNFSDMILIRSENEQIKQGINPPVLLLDNHAEHIIMHKAVFSSPEAREDPQIVEAGLAHELEHIKQMREVPADLAAIIAGQPLPQLAPQGPDETMPTVQGARMPSMPNGVPPQVEDNYNKALQAIPEEEEMMQ